MIANDDISKSGVYASEVLEFVTLANEYCLWMEESGQLKSVQFIEQAVRILSGIYNQVLKLKDTEPVLEGGNEKFVTEKDWSDIFQKTVHLLGPHNSYLRLADSDEFDRSDLVTHMVSEDLADIYQDLNDFIRQFRQGIEEVMNDAIWEVMSSFEQYWGTKLLNALTALHQLYVNKTDPETDSIGENKKESNDENSPTYDNSFFTKLQDSNEEEI